MKGWIEVTDKYGIATLLNVSHILTISPISVLSEKAAGTRIHIEFAIGDGGDNLLSDNYKEEYETIRKMISDAVY